MWVLCFLWRSNAWVAEAGVGGGVEVLEDVVGVAGGRGAFMNGYD